jgi:PIN domain nuclease of toxin-antitoxin system
MGALRALLDTCTFLWMTAEPTNLSSRASVVINESSNSLYLSDVSIWEICLKWQTGKFKLPSPPRDWCEHQLSIWKMEPLKIERTHLFRVTEMPIHHKDPFDRLLVAQALEERLTVVTPDAHISKYPVPVVW